MNSAHILVVEDEGLVALDICNQLAKMGFEDVRSVPNAERAMQEFRRQPPDLALLDIQLEGSIDGVELARTIKEHSSTPVIYMTAFTDPATINRAVDTAPDGYLVKPIADRDLETTVTTVLERRMLEKQRILTEKRNHELEAQLLQAQKMDALGKLTAGIAHELNNALLVIGGNVDLAINVVDPDSQVMSHLESARTGGQRCASLISKLLCVARHGVFRPKTVQLKSVLDSSLGFLRPIINKDVELLIGNIDPGLEIYCDQEQFTQVVTNLVINSQQSFSRGGRITFIATNEFVRSPDMFNPEAVASEYVVLRVGDSGPGIDPEARDRVFEPFFTTKPMGEGAGLGLSIVYNIMQRHGGWVSVESTSSVGTVFSLYFPKNIEQLDSESAPDDSLPVLQVADARSSGSVLVLDDEEMIVEVVSRHLENSGYQVKGFSDPYAALEWFSLYHIEVGLIILDMKMPVLAGEECFERFREIDPKVKILLFSGYAQDQSIVNLLNQGAQGFFQKPVDFERLISHLKHLFAENEVVKI